MSGRIPPLNINYRDFLQAFRSITRATDERTLIVGLIPKSGVGNSAPVIGYERAHAVASILILANMNSLPLDWSACSAIGGTNMNFFIVKQLPVLPPEEFLKQSKCGHPWVQLIVPRGLELNYTSHEMTGFANDLGFQGPPFTWDEGRRHCLKSELDAIFAHMYGLERSDLEWILDAPAPNSSFSVLKKHEAKEFGEYRTKRYVLQAFDLLSHGKTPELENVEHPFQGTRRS